MSEDIKKKLDSRSPCIGKRYIVAMMGFIICTLLNIHRLVIGVAIVAMVKHKQKENTLHNSSTLSCPYVSGSKNTTDVFTGGDLDWSTEQQGYVLGVSFVGYVITQLPGGRLAETYGAKRIVVAGNVLAAVSTFFTPMATWWGIYAVIGVQFLRGLGQGVGFSALFVLMANWFPRSERGFLSSIVVSGFGVGGTMGGVVTGWLCDEPHLGWEAAFFVIGVYSATVSITFYFVICENPQKHPTITHRELKLITESQEGDLSSMRPPTPWRKILTSVPVYALCFGLLGQHWFVTHFLTVHPTYMGTILHFSMTENGAASSIPISLKSVGGLCACFFTHWITKNKYMGVSKLRKACNSVGTLGFSLCLLGVYWAKCDHLINIICFSLSLFCSGVSLSGSMITSVDMSPRYSGSLMGFAQTCASTSTFIIPVLVGFLTKDQSIEEWHTFFFISIAIVLTCGIIFIVFGSAEVQPWNDPEHQEPPKAKSEEPNYVNKQSMITKF